MHLLLLFKYYSKRKMKFRIRMGEWKKGTQKRKMAWSWVWGAHHSTAALGFDPYKLELHASGLLCTSLVCPIAY